jgi:hypothetical protein
MSDLSITLPRPDGTLERHRLGEPGTWPSAPARPLCRTAYAAAHVVADPLADNAPGRPAVLDWDATLAFRHHLWRHGLAVADAMDTAQRGMGLTWETTAELIRRSGAEAAAVGGRLACGVGTDHAPQAATLDEVVTAYLEQLEVVEEAGATPILMASRQLAALAGSADDYLKVCGRVIEQAGRPVILHWLGPMFDPALTGYWGSEDVGTAMGLVLELLHRHQGRVDGIKLSLLDESHEVNLRSRLPEGVTMYTGDDFNYPGLIAGDGERHSHALLGVFGAIAPAAAAALHALGHGDLDGYHATFAPTVPLARHLFAAPTYYYKTGIVFLAWLNGHQNGFRMVGGLESGRSVTHLAEAFRLADRAGLLRDPDLAAARMRRLLDVAGVRS